MKRILTALLLILLSAQLVQAQYTRTQIKSRLVGQGMSPELSGEIASLLTGNSIYTGSLAFGSSTGGITHTLGTVAAAGSTQGTATAITARITLVTGASGTNGVILPATPVVGGIYQIVNTAAAVLLIYPGTGDAINATAANGSVSIAASVPVFCLATSASQWWCSEGVAP